MSDEKKTLEAPSFDVAYDPKMAEDGVLLSVRHLKQYFASGEYKTKAVHDVSFDVKEGECFGIVGMASYAAAGLQNLITGVLLDNHIVDGVHDFTYVSYFWLGAAILAVPSVPIFCKHLVNFRRIRTGEELRLSFLWDREKELRRIGRL